jgi:pimeloyl-ACP methyl ester carboxylesterase
VVISPTTCRFYLVVNWPSIVSGTDLAKPTLFANMSVHRRPILNVIQSHGSQIQRQLSDSQTVILPDGRTLGYAEWGSPNGSPLLYFHGFPSSRLEAYGLQSMAANRNIRIFSLDRPGFGLSTYDPRRRIMDWPADVQDFASQVGISQFSVLGVSGGGPYALACAKQLPRERLRAVGVLAGAPVWDSGFRTQGVPWYARLLYLAVKCWPSGVKAVLDGLVGVLRWVAGTRLAEKRIDASLDALTRAQAAKKTEEESNDEKSAHDSTMDQKQQLPVESIPQRRTRLIRLLFEAFAQGTAGMILETRLLTHDWGFELEDVMHEHIRMWHGSKDANAPVRSIRDMSRRMPHCVLKEYNETHFTMGDHFDEVLDELIPEDTKS